MKSFLLLLIATIVLFSPGNAQTSKYFVGNGEYQNFILDNTTHTLYGLGTAGNGIGSNTPQTGYATPCQFPSAGTQIKYVASGLHTGAAVDMSGNVYFTGGNEDGTLGNGTTSGSSKGFTQVTTDSAGNTFTGVNYLAMGSSRFTGGAGYGAIIFAVKDDGTLWVWGNTQGGYRGDGTYGRVNTRPVQVPFPAGTVITKVTEMNIVIALDKAGNVWTWGGNGGNNPLLGNNTRADYMTPQKIALPGPAKDIAGGGMWSYALLQSGQLYGWGLYLGYAGVGASAGQGWTNQPAPMLLDGQLNLPAPISKISCNNTSTYVILTDGTLWGWGGNECGQIGNGQEINWAKYTTNPSPYGGTTPAPYAWDWDLANAQLQQHKPTQIAPGINNFVSISEGMEAVFYKFAVDANGQIYSWGRNKAGVLGNGVMDGAYTNGALGSLYPNSWDVPWITAVNPIGTGLKTIQMTSPECILNPVATSCNIFAIVTNTKPSVNAGPNQTVTGTTANLDGSGSTDNGNIVYHIWSQVSGPNNALIVIPSGLKPQVRNLVTGTYKFQLKCTDNGWLSDSTTVTITVNGGGPATPTANAGNDQTITLPQSTTTLTGSGSESGGTISGYAWTQLSGPATATIASPTQASTAISALVQGVYTFQLKVTDNSGVTATAQVKVTVNAAPVVPGPPSANAGSDQTITLPTSSVTLTGSGTETNGTITNYAWTEVSGPNAATIASATQTSTNITGLIQGVYTFQLKVTDNSGVTATDQVKVTVNAAPVVPGPPSANAGSDQTITLPTNSATLVGSGTETNGTIVGYAWTQVSGPSTATIASATLATTKVNALVQGVYTFQLKVTDNSGVTATDQVKVTVNAAPVVPGPPSANAGTNQAITLPVNSTTLTGSGSETNGTIVGYSWTQVSGPSTATIGTPTQASTTVGAMVQGVYTFQLKVTDNSGVTATDQVDVTVKPAPVVGVPSANAGANQTITLPVNSATLTGSGTETGGGSIVGYSWTQVSGPSTATIGTPTQPVTTVGALVQGIYTFKLTVTDNAGATAFDLVDVTVKAAPVVPGPPSANAGANQTITLPVNSVTLAGSGSETNGTIVSYSWIEIGGPTKPSVATISSPTQAGTTVTGMVQGDYTFQLTVTDNSGVTASDVVVVSVKAAVVVPGAPVANAGSNQTIQAPVSSATLSGSGSETNGTIVSYSWAEVSGPGTATILGASQAVTAVSGLVPGVYVFKLTITDNSGVSASATVQVTVNPPANKPPVANAGPDQTLKDAATTAQLDGSASYDPDGNIVSYAWVQLSGLGGVTIVKANTATPTIQGLAPGTYAFRLTVTDNNGATATDDVILTILAATTPPTTPPTNPGTGTLVANAGQTDTVMLPETQTTLSGAGSSVSSGSIVGYSWQQVSGPSNVTIASPADQVTQVSNLKAGIYTFLLTVTDDNGDSATAKVSVIVLSNTQRYNTSVKLYPNPAHDVLNIYYKSATHGQFTIRVYGVSGINLISGQYENEAGEGTYRINVSALSRGVYTLVITDSNGSKQVSHFVKQ